MRAGILRGLGPRVFALIETTGRRTGLPRQTPVGNGLEAPDVFWVVAEHGRNCSYVANMLADPAVRVCINGNWWQGTATVDTGDDALARRTRIDQANGLLGRLDGLVFRATATTPLSIKIRLEPEPNT